MQVGQGVMYGPVTEKEIKKGRLLKEVVIDNPLIGKSTAKIYYDNKGRIIIPGPILLENLRRRRNQILKIVEKNKFAWPLVSRVADLLKASGKICRLLKRKTNYDHGGALSPETVSLGI